MIVPSAREKQILELLSRGCDQRQTAQITGLAESTIRLYTFRLREKLGADNSYHLLAIAFRRGYVK